MSYLKDTKKLYWLKLMKNFFQQARIKKLRKVAGGDTYTLIYLKMMLLVINNDGIYEYEGIESTIEEELALVLDEDEDNVKVVCAFLISNHLIMEKNNKYYLVEVPDLIGSETPAASRKRKQRAKEKLLCDNVTLESQEVTDSHTELELDDTTTTTIYKEKAKEYGLDDDVEFNIEMERWKEYNSNSPHKINIFYWESWLIQYQKKEMQKIKQLKGA